MIEVHKGFAQTLTRARVCVLRPRFNIPTTFQTAANHEFHVSDAQSP